MRRMRMTKGLKADPFHLNVCLNVSTIVVLPEFSVVPVIRVYGDIFSKHAATSS